MPTVTGVYLKYVVTSLCCAAAARSLDSEARFLAWCALWYCAALQMLVAACFVLRVGMSMLGKSPQTGQVPWWSYLLFWGFHLYLDKLFERWQAAHGYGAACDGAEQFETPPRWWKVPSALSDGPAPPDPWMI